MFSTVDTIVAIATPAGRGGLGVVRISGASASHIAQTLLGRATPLQPRHATFTRVRGLSPPSTPSSPAPAGAADPAAARAIDQVIATFFPAPRSYTGDDTIEISGHGSPLVLQHIVEAAIRAGARLAEPGEFTLRAFLNGRIDLVQAEAVADLIEAVTPRQARAACDQLEGTLTGALTEIEAALFELIARLEASIDFPDEGYHFIEPQRVLAEVSRVAGTLDALLARAHEGRLIREGARVVILGKPNVGKSSLFNFLVGAGRAIVTEQPGTTRDLLTETADIEGLKVTLVDTAGLRESRDPIEAEGIARARSAAAVADLRIVVLDGSRAIDAEDEALIGDGIECGKLYVVNKIDIGPARDAAAGSWPGAGRTVRVSLKTGEGTGRLAAEIRSALGVEGAERDTVAVTNRRHIGLMEAARSALGRAVENLEAAGGELSEEFVLQDLHAAGAALEEVRGRRAPEELLEHIFSRFCIGK